MRNAIFYLLFIVPLTFCAQEKGDYNWQLGQRSNPHTNSFPASLEIKFDSGLVIIDTFFRSMKMGYFNSSISNSNGDLLLYSNGCFINDGNHEYIPESDNLSPGSIDEEWCDQPPGEYPIHEGGLFLSFNNDSLILLLHQRQIVEGPPLRIYVDALFYTSLDREEGSYSINEKSIPIIEDSLSEGRLEAIQSMEPDYWWVIQGKRNSNIYYTIGIEKGEIDTTFTQIIGDTTIKRGEAAAQSVFSPDGTKYARYSPADDLFLFDFDRSSGLLSNYRKLHVADSGSIGGLAFSSNSQFLYANSLLDLYQFDILSKNIEASKVHIAHYDGFASPFPTSFYHMQLGPDCKIYMIPPNGAQSMHVINHPNKAGLACEFKQHSLQFPVYNSITLPNFPVFRSFSENPCIENLETGLEIFIDRNTFPIYPNPVTDQLIIKVDEKVLAELMEITIFNSSGDIVFGEKFKWPDENVILSLSNLASGVYFINIISNNSIYVEKFVKL